MRLLPQIIAWLSAAAYSAPCFAAVPVEVQQSRLAEGVYQFTVKADGYVENLNSLVLIGDHDVVVFDTTTRPSSAREILSRIRRLTRKPIRYVINSHWHPDHWSGNEVFASANPGVEIVATTQMRDFMLNMRPFLRQRIPQLLAAQEKTVAANHEKNVGPNGEPLTPALRRQIDDELQMIRDMAAEQIALRPVFPTLTFTDRLTLHQGDREIRLISVTGDAEATTILYLPREKILAAGDAISWPLPYYTPPIRRQAASLRELAQLETVAIVPGHGPAMRDKRYLDLEISLFEAVLAQVEQALRGGAGTLEEVATKVDLAALKRRFIALDAQVATAWDGWVQGLIKNAYVDLRDSKQPPAPIP